MSKISKSAVYRVSVTLSSRARAGFNLILGIGILGLAPLQAQNAYVQHNLVSDLPGVADRTDTNLVNPWAIATSATSPFWLSDNHTGLSTLYNSTGGVLALVVTIPPATNATPPAAPTGMVFNGDPKSFLLGTNQAARFIFSGEDGTITAWNSGSNAVLKVDNSLAGSIYKGLALASAGGSNFLYATDFHNGKVDAFDSSFQPVSLPGGFTDTNLPAGFAPFGIQAVAGKLYVTYALQDTNREDDVPGPSQGYVDVFDPTGQLIQRFASAGPLNSPWGIALAPAGFGAFSSALLIGNFGDGVINAFDSLTGALLGHLQDTNGAPITIPGLWGIRFGNGAQGGELGKLYFAAGIPGDGAIEDHGLFGSIAVANSVTAHITPDTTNTISLSWIGGTAPYLVQRKTTLPASAWFDVLTTSNQTALVAADATNVFFRIMDHAPANVTAFTVLLTGESEVPGVDVTGSGFGVMSLKGTNLTYQIEFTGLTGPAAAAHIHGPADTTQSTGVIVPLSFTANAAGLMSGGVDVSTFTSNQLAALKGGRTYVNIHTTEHGGGEIRGQLVPVNYVANLSGAGEVPPVSTAGTASASLTLIGNQLSWTVNYTGLSSSAVAAHVHGKASPTESAGVLFEIGSPTGTSGTISGKHVLTTDEFNAVVNGQTYINIHTTDHGGGEIRGQLLPAGN